MKKEDMSGIAILLVIVAIALFGGAKGASRLSSNQPPVQNQADIARQVQQAQIQTEDLKKKVQTEADKKTHSPYYGQVKFSYVNRGGDLSQEYVALRVNSEINSPILITGWRLTSTSTGNTVTIPKGTPLYWSGSINSEDPIYVRGGDTLYLVTGTSPNGYSFRLNKCSGYLGQFQTYTPYINTACPAPRAEDTSSIPHIVSNDSCLQYIESFPSCRIDTQTPPANWTYECKKFFETKIGYSQCINTHKGDADFDAREWRIYLKHSSRLWKDNRETIILYDTNGKIVDQITY